jgi:hypothetical protein
VDLYVEGGSTISAWLATYGTTNKSENILTGAGIIYNDDVPDTSYHADNILGTVSQSGGVPTGAVIERGSTVNGAYVRYADGTQICTHAMKAEFLDSSQLDASWVFPAAFSGSDQYSWSAMMQRRSPANVSEGMAFSKIRDSAVMESAHDHTLANVRVISNGLYASGDFVWLSLTATGRWF